MGKASCIIWSVPPGIVPGISDFAVCPKLPESYHLALTLSINCVTDRSGAPESSENSHQSWGWVPCYKYEWSTADLHRINETLTDYHSKDCRHRFIDRMIELENVDNVAMAFGNYINQACDLVCKVNQGNRSKGLKWYDTECRLKRAEAVKIGEMAICGEADMHTALQVCGQYRAMKQRKRRNFVKNNLNEVKQAFSSNRTEMWQILNNLSNKRKQNIGPVPRDISIISKSYLYLQTRPILIMIMKIRLRIRCFEFTYSKTNSIRRYLDSLLCRLLLSFRFNKP